MSAIRITSCRDLDAVLAEALTPQWPAIPRAVMEDWKAGRCKIDPFGDLPKFSSEPTVAYALRQRMRELGWEWMAQYRPRFEDHWAEFCKGRVHAQKHHPDEHTAFALAAAQALGADLVLVEGWDK